MRIAHPLASGMHEWSHVIEHLEMVIVELFDLAISAQVEVDEIAIDRQLPDHFYRIDLRGRQAARDGSARTP